jgi:uncharacterized protein (DUF2141 family)
MRTIVVTAFLCLACACAAPPKVSPPDATATLTIRVVGLTSAEGQLHIALFESEESWLESAAYETVLEADDAAGGWTIENLPSGDYAVAVFHDENGNGLQDRNLVGMPTEPYGFSNDARRPLGPASWKEAVIVVSNPLQEIEIGVE